MGRGDTSFGKAQAAGKKPDGVPRVSGDLLDSLVRYSRDIITIIKPDGTCVFVSPPARQLLGYDETLIIGTNIFGLIHPDDHAATRAALESIIQSPEQAVTAEYRCRHADGHWVRMEGVGSNRIDDPSIGGIIISSRDITERHATREALRESELKFKALAESTPSAIFIWQDDSIKYVNPASERLTGFTKEEFYRMNIWDMIHPDHREKTVTRGQARIRGELVPVYNQFKVLTKSGEERWADVGATVIDYNGRPAVLGTAFDITEYKRIEEDLARKAFELEAIFRALPDLFFRLDRDGKILDSIAGTQSDLIMPREQFLGKNIREVTPPFLADITCNAIREVLSGAPCVIKEYSLNLGGSEEYFEARYVPMMDDQVVSIVRNITEKKKNEFEIQKAQKLDSIGILAGGIAHDFNNILAAVLGNISLARFYGPPGGKFHAKLEEAEKSIDRARDLTRQLLTFSRGGAPVKKPMRINSLLIDTVNFTLSGSPAECSFNIDPDLWPAEIDDGQISQVINNIIINAIQAMPSGGTIAIEAKNFTSAGNAPGKRGFSIRRGEYVLIAFKDQGMGIPGEHLDRIFDPYFSMKKDGTGLGLATSYSIIKRHNGYIDVESDPGRGTTITLYLPASPGTVPLEQVADHDFVTGTGRILVMDDEEAILDVCLEMLHRLGYTTEPSRDGREALEKYRSAMADEPFSAVIMDLTIRGGMGGVDCIRELLAMDPGAKVLVSSGYSNDPIMSSYLNYGFRGFIIKPYDIVELGHALDRLLAS
jgi:PAS domain S-box-containing protein